MNPASRLARGTARAVPIVGAVAILLAAPAAGSAQEPPDSLRADTLAAAADSVRLPGDSAQAADSTRQAIMRRLERLARAPGADSALYLQDSIRLASQQEGAPVGTGPDEVTRALTGMPGYSVTQYEGRSADFTARERLLVLFAPPEGRARVSAEGSVIEADTSIVYNEGTGSIRAIGGATFTPPDGDPVDAADMVYDLSQGRGTALDAETSWNQQGATWIVRGDMPYAAPDSTFMAHARFTSCEIDEPHYHFETDEIKIVAGNVLVARGVRLYFADVPVAWLPFMAQSLSRGRASGILTPRFSVNDVVRTSSSYQRRVSNMGFYWAMSDYSDALFAMDWFSDNFFSLTTSIQYRWSRQFLNGDLSFRRYWNADGSREYALDTRHDWQMDERTRLNISARFINETDFVREYSTNPAEVTSSIDSDAGINRRFDWGMVSASASRKQYLSDDRTEWLLPSLNVSLSPITLFSAPSSEAGFFNNMTWSASVGATRNSIDYGMPAPTDTFSISEASTVSSSGTASSNLSIGRLTFSQGLSLRELRTLDVPEMYLDGEEGLPPVIIGDSPLRDVAEANLSWRASVNYQQQLIGSTTLTPRLEVSGNMLRSDTDSLAQNFVQAPSRLTFGANLKTDIYGFFGGIGGFEAIRHKISPSIDYQYSPQTTPTALQEEVFGRRAVQPVNAISLSLTQTFEAKREAPDGDDPGVVEAPPVSDQTLAEVDPSGALVDESGRLVDPNAPGTAQFDEIGGPRRVQQNPSVTLLAWRMSAVRYDFVEADSVGSFLSGFETISLTNQFSSDFLRGMSISMQHSLFDDTYEDRNLVDRRFDPHLERLNLSFSVGSSSSIFRWLGFGNDGREEPEGVDPLAIGGPTDESTIVPITGRGQVNPPVRSSGGGGGWTANLSYSLQRPRDELLGVSQTLNGTFRMDPTPNWSVSWRTSYDLERGAFNDHSVRLSRDLHRWQANFDFLKTATGNWTFRFEVSLLDNQDLKIDYSQRNLDLGLPPSQR